MRANVVTALFELETALRNTVSSAHNSIAAGEQIRTGTQAQTVNQSINLRLAGRPQTHQLGADLAK